MTYLRRQVSLPAHGAIEIGLGLTFIAPGRYATTWRAHLDSLLAVATAAAALGVAAAGDATAAIFLAIMTGVLVCLNLGTRYVEAA